MRWSALARRLCSRQRANPIITATSGIVGLVAYDVVSRHSWTDAAADVGIYVLFGSVWFLFTRDVGRVWREIKTPPPP